MTRLDENIECARLHGIKKHHLEKLYKAGWSDQQVADFFGVSLRAILRWRQTFPNIKQDIKDWKQQADADIEKSLYQSAKGYSCREDKVQIDWINGKRKITRIKTVKHYPPNQRSCEFWLTNRQHGDWKRTREAEGTDPLSVKVYNIMQAHKNGNGNGNGNGHGKKQKLSDGRTVENVVQSSVSIERGGMRIIE